MIRFTWMSAAFLFTIGASARGQVRILPRSTAPGVTESYVLQVANDHRQDITRIELRFPESIRITALGVRSDWTVQSVATGQRLSAAIWTGALAPGRFTELGFIGVNPPRSVVLVWPVIVSYADGDRVMWWTGNIAHKAPRTVVSTPGAVNTNLVVAFAVCIVALVLALTALALSLRAGSATPTAFGGESG